MPVLNPLQALSDKGIWFRGGIRGPAPVVAFKVWSRIPMPARTDPGNLQSKLLLHALPPPRVLSPAAAIKYLRQRAQSGHYKLQEPSFQFCPAANWHLVRS